jgi:hypothetical protein
MQKFPRPAQLLFVALLGSGTAAFAQGTTEMPPPTEPAPAESSPGTMPAAGEASSATTTTTEAPPLAADGASAAAEETPSVAATAAKPTGAGQLGFAARWRYVSVPSWFLGLFAEKNVALSTLNAWALEGLWRKRDKDNPDRTWEIMVSGGYQNMSPPDGIWLGRGKELTQDADLVQAKGFGLITFDAAYVIRQFFNPYFGIHYGAGLGLGIVRGKILRTSATCNETTGKCEVVSVTQHCGGVNPPCTEQQLKATETGSDDLGPTDPHRFEETSVPGAIPIINLLFGLDFRIPLPDTSNIEFRLEGGFYDAFFVGLTAGYVLKPL